jgi:hypothetical protein
LLSGLASTRTALTGKRLRTVLVQEVESCDWDRHCGCAKTHQDKESSNFPSDCA